MPTKILAIDDSKTMRLAIKITFAAEDAEVVAVGKGADAVARAKQLAADVVLVDWRLSDGDPSGEEVCRALKADPDTAKIPVFLLTSGQEPLDDARVRACGAEGAIAKPFDTQDLIEKVTGAAGKPATGVVKPLAASASAQVQAPRAPAPAPAPAVSAPSRPTSAPSPAAARPAPAPSVAAPAAAPAPRSAPSPAAVAPVAAIAGGARPAAAASSDAASHADIPIAIPIPFAPAGQLTPGMLQRLQDAHGGGAPIAGLDPKALAALVSLSRDVIEQIVWEVVPDLAEQIIREQRSGSA